MARIYPSAFEHAYTIKIEKGRITWHLSVWSVSPRDVREETWGDAAIETIVELATSE